MADPSGEKPSAPQKGSGSGDQSEEQTSECTKMPLSGNDGNGSPSPPMASPLAQTPVKQPHVAQARELSSRSTKKKGKMGMDTGKGITVAFAEEPEKKKFASLENLPGRARTCSICRREFPTARALFGHMRSHPERMWRGAHPPPVSPRWEVVAKHEEGKLGAEKTQEAQELTRSLLNIGERILRMGKVQGKGGRNPIWWNECRFIFGFHIDTPWQREEEEGEEKEEEDPGSG